MPVLGLYSWRKDSGLGRVQYRIEKHIALEQSRFVYLEKDIPLRMGKTDAPAVFSEIIEFLSLATDEGNELYQVGHIADIEEYRKLNDIFKLASELDAELAEIRSLMGIAQIKGGFDSLAKMSNVLKSEGREITDFVRTMRRKWYAEMRGNSNKLMGFSAFSSERLAKQMKIDTRRLVSEYFDFNDSMRDIEEDLKKLRKDYQNLMAKKETMEQSKYIGAFRNDLSDTEKRYIKLISVVKQEQQQMEDIYKLDFVLLFRLRDRLDKFKTEVLDKILQTGFGQLRAEDVVETKDSKAKVPVFKLVGLPKGIKDDIEQGKAPMQVIASFYEATKILIQRLEDRLGREEFVAAKAAIAA